MVDNNIGSFEDYIESIKTLIKENRKEYNNIGISIKNLSFLISEVEPNFQYFRECYDANQTPSEALINLKYNEDELYRKVDNITDRFILNEIESRCLTREVISDCYTDDLEEEIRDRHDASLVDKDSLDDEELFEILASRRKYFFNGNDKKSIICEILGFSNDFGYSIEEAINELKNIW